jgi:nucleotide-binding universal stress UspA family protein
MEAQLSLRNILFPTDFSKSCEAIADHVAGVARLARATVWLLNVVPRLEEWHGASEMYFGPFSDSALAAFEKDRKFLEGQRVSALQRFQKEYFAEINSEISVASGGVAETIVDFAREKNVGMLMMPTHTLGRHRRFLLGSITAKILHDAPCPVWTSPHPRELDPFRPYRRILLALDYRSPGIPSLVGASEFAQLFGARLTVFSAIPHPPDTSADLIQQLKSDAASKLERCLRECNVNASIRLREGNPGDVIREVAEEIEGADLIITGRALLDTTKGHVHSHSSEIIWNAPCPVITL